MGASLLAKGPFQPTSALADTPLSRAGSLPHWISVGSKKSVHSNNNCRSEPARDEGKTFNFFSG
ncbi:hypothetical protein C1894_03915 [Pseudomonas sp. FW305-3-2-15-E-TSA2]|nr:hypothetical protein C1894_03915 [Pseudomonas sp. FW305-3-2-15-E-TSA2]